MESVTVTVKALAVLALKEEMVRPVKVTLLLVVICVLPCIATVRDFVPDGQLAWKVKLPDETVEVASQVHPTGQVMAAV